MVGGGKRAKTRPRDAGRALPPGPHPRRTTPDENENAAAESKGAASGPFGASKAVALGARGRRWAFLLAAGRKGRPAEAAVVRRGERERELSKNQNGLANVRGRSRASRGPQTRRKAARKQPYLHSHVFRRARAAQRLREGSKEPAKKAGERRRRQHRESLLRAPAPARYWGVCLALRSVKGGRKVEVLTRDETRKEGGQLEKGGAGADVGFHLPRESSLSSLCRRHQTTATTAAQCVRFTTNDWPWVAFTQADTHARATIKEGSARAGRLEEKDAGSREQKERAAAARHRSHSRSLSPHRHPSSLKA